jgi:hypothetical protein
MSGRNRRQNSRSFAGLMYGPSNQLSNATKELRKTPYRTLATFPAALGGLRHSCSVCAVSGFQISFLETIADFL